MVLLRLIIISIFFWNSDRIIGHGALWHDGHLQSNQTHSVQWRAFDALSEAPILQIYYEDETRVLVAVVLADGYCEVYPGLVGGDKGADAVSIKIDVEHIDVIDKLGKQAEDTFDYNIWIAPPGSKVLTFDFGDRSITWDRKVDVSRLSAPSSLSLKQTRLLAEIDCTIRYILADAVVRNEEMPQRPDAKLALKSFKDAVAESSWYEHVLQNGFNLE